jgi:membrane protein DedA with SNARE-associated domain
MTAQWITDLVHSALLFPALFALVVADAFVVILPSEIAVVALATLSAATGSPSLPALIAVAMSGAIVGDSLCYLIGRRVGFDRWEWQRRGKLGAALARARRTILARPAALIFTARYIPFARIAVNFAAGATPVPYGRYLPLSCAAGLGWAAYNSVIGAFFGNLLKQYPLLAVVTSVAVAITLGITVDLIARQFSRWRTRRRADRALDGPA